MCLLGILKDIISLVCGVSYIVIASIALSTVLNIVSIWFFTRAMLNGLLLRVNQLDSTIAEAIKAVMGEGIQQAVEVNPIQLMIMDLIKSNMTPKVPDLDKLRNSEGKFA